MIYRQHRKEHVKQIPFKRKMIIEIQDESSYYKMVTNNESFEGIKHNFPLRFVARGGLAGSPPSEVPSTRVGQESIRAVSPFRKI